MMRELLENWIGSTGRDDLLEQLAQDLNEADDRLRHEREEMIIHAIDNAYQLGFNDGCEVGAEVDA